MKHCQLKYDYRNQSSLNTVRLTNNIIYKKKAKLWLPNSNILILFLENTLRDVTLQYYAPFEINNVWLEAPALLVV
jgi:hypothetical protein